MSTPGSRRAKQVAKVYLAVREQGDDTPDFALESLTPEEWPVFDAERRRIAAALAASVPADVWAEFAMGRSR